MGRPSSTQSRSVMTRDLDNISFEVVVLRPSCANNAADIVYIDDGSIECDVPWDELTLAEEDSNWEPEVLETRFEQGVNRLLAEEEERMSRPSTTDMRWEQGKYVADDGSGPLCCWNCRRTHEEFRFQDAPF